KNAASGSMVIDENRIRDDTHQQPKKRGLDSNFTSMREDFRVALNTLSGDLKREIHKLRDSLMGEITKIREEFGEEEVIEELVLRLLDVTMSFELHTNASDFAIGGVLMQDGHPIAFESRKLYETKRKYTV
ncbi:putative retrotransposon gag domain, nucleotide-binding alpha-beta plait domain protein, partial [Tanacetum coccineum]